MPIFYQEAHAKLLCVFTGYAFAVVLVLGLSAGYNTAIAGDIQSGQNAPFPFSMSCTEQNDLCTAHDIIAEASCKKVFFSVDSDQNLHLEIFEHKDDFTSFKEPKATMNIALSENEPDVKAWFLYEAVKCANLNAAYDLANLIKEGAITAPAKVTSKDLYRFVTLSDMSLAQGKEVCIQKFDDMLNNETPFFDMKTPAHVEQVKWAQSLCTYDEQELQEAAHDYLNENDPNWHAILAYSILNQINSTDDSIIELRSQAAHRGWPQLEKDLSARANLYFPPVQPDEYVELFAEYEVDTCEEFKEKYLTSDAENALFMQAMTYQLGICIPQDLHKAQKLYQELYNDAPADLGPFAIWLGMIYQYGPEDIRNLDKARFFYKQAILAFAWDDPRNTPQLRRQAVRNLMNDQLPIPELLESELLWLDKVMTKSEKERREIRKELEKEGYAHLDGIYNPPIVEDMYGLRPDIDREEFQSLSTEEQISIVTFSTLKYLYKTFKRDDWGDLNTAYRLNEFRIFALRTESTDLEQSISDIKDAGINAPEFIEMLQDAIEWARPQKQKNADELYKLSQTFTIPHSKPLSLQEKDYRRAYLALAAAKGHQQALEEKTKQEKELRESLERDEKEWEKQPSPQSP